MDKCSPSIFKKWLLKKLFNPCGENDQLIVQLLHSAWHQKFDTEYEGFWSYKKYIYVIQTFEDENATQDPRYLVSFKAFLKYIVHVASDIDFNEHWQSYDYSCSPCTMNYHYVTKQESSAADASFILRQRNLTDITYLPEAYDDHTEASPKELFNTHGINNEIALQLYAIYYSDFIMYNYSIDEFLET
ncbi:unnamed protein product [Oikopleura dioica]|uniref:Carbohydrate sulfotransferase n=1 Tax=Oikopleura dioica TaxID=34765 RepID=E4Y6G3_OIKDI|nr:unnamed protein product [Oikopleura dioica]